MSKQKNYENDVVVKGGVYTGYSAYDSKDNLISGGYDTSQEANYAAQKMIENNDKDE